MHRSCEAKVGKNNVRIRTTLFILSSAVQLTLATDNRGLIDGLAVTTQRLWRAGCATSDGSNPPRAYPADSATLFGPGRESAAALPESSQETTLGSAGNDRHHFHSRRYCHPEGDPALPGDIEGGV